MFFFHPLQGSSLKNLLKLYRSNKIDFQYLFRAIYILIRVLLGLPFRVLDKQFYTKKIIAKPINSPLFILGHWRSGTTLLHVTLSLDAQFCYPTWGDVFAPNANITGKPIINFLGKIVPSVKRPMDDMTIDVKQPSEDEFVLSNMGCITPYDGFYFPSHYSQYSRYTFLDELAEDERLIWKAKMLEFYKKMSYLNPNKIILSKNPPHTARIKYLLEIFPHAKFIHIYRNPYVVFLSTMHSVEQLMAALTLQSYQVNFEQQVFSNYRKMMELFYKNQFLIPAENLIEIKFEDFEQQPMRELEKIYMNLRLKNFDTMKDKFINYFDKLKHYQKNQFIVTDEVIKKIYQHWNFTIDRWGYTPHN